MPRTEGKENAPRARPGHGRPSKPASAGKARAVARREEQARKNAAWTLVRAADEHADPLGALLAPGCAHFAALGVRLRCVRPSAMSSAEKEAAWRLIKDNMLGIYEASEQGWDERVKHQEDFDEKAWFLLAQTESAELLGLANFRFDLDFDDPVLYCYEVQIAEVARRQGLARFLLLSLLQMAARTNMRKVMATVFKSNNASRSLFVDKMRFLVDETDPSEAEDDVTAEYLIVSRIMPNFNAALLEKAAAAK